MNGEHRYNPWEHASHAGVAIEWCDDCLAPGVDHAYSADHDTLILRPEQPADRLNLAAAIGLAERDLHHGQAPDGMTDPLTIAAHRLLPPAQLHEAMVRNHGGITAVAADLTVPPTLIRTRLDTLTEHERADLQAAIDAADPEEPTPTGRDPVRIIVGAARAAIAEGLARLRRREPRRRGHRQGTKAESATDTCDCAERVDTTR